MKTETTLVVIQEIDVDHAWSMLTPCIIHLTWPFSAFDPETKMSLT